MYGSHTLTSCLPALSSPKPTTHFENKDEVRFSQKHRRHEHLQGEFLRPNHCLRYFPEATLTETALPCWGHTSGDQGRDIYVGVWCTNPQLLQTQHLTMHVHPGTLAQGHPEVLTASFPSRDHLSPARPPQPRSRNDPALGHMRAETWRREGSITL